MRRLEKRGGASGTRSGDGDSESLNAEQPQLFNLATEMIQGSGFALRASKFDFFFGRVTSNPKNQQRSLQNLENLKQLGVDEAGGGRERLMQIFVQGLTAQKIREEKK